MNGRRSGDIAGERIRYVCFFHERELRVAALFQNRTNRGNWNDFSLSLFSAEENRLPFLRPFSRDVASVVNSTPSLRFFVAAAPMKLFTRDFLLRRPRSDRVNKKYSNAGTGIQLCSD